MQTVREALVAVRELLTPESAWTKNEFALNARGEQVVIADPGAVCWCLSGAISRVIDEVEIRALTRSVIRKRIGTVTSWNDADERTHADVLNLLDRAIAEAPNAR